MQEKISHTSAILFAMEHIKCTGYFSNKLMCILLDTQVLLCLGVGLGTAISILDSNIEQRCHVIVCTRINQLRLLRLFKDRNENFLIKLNMEDMFR